MGIGFILPLTLFVFCAVTIYGAICDVKGFTIPNSVPLALVADFAIYACLTWGLRPILLQVGLALLTFTICYVFWRLRHIGGGDVKFISALALWMHPQKIAVFFLLLSLLSVAFIMALKWLRQWNAYFQQSKVPVVLKNLMDKTEQQVIPYGVPAALSALAVIFLIN
jgi:prepilin peptidase CpaA